MKQSTQSFASTWMTHWTKKRNQEVINVDESKQSRIKHDISDTSAKNLNPFGDGVYKKQKTDSNHTYFNKFSTVTPLFSGAKIRSLQRFMDSEPQQEGISQLANAKKNVENASDFEEHKNSKGKEIQSLDKETVLSYAEHVNEPGGRWPKRLRLMSGTSSRSITTNSSEDYMEKSRNDHGKEVAMVIDEATTLKTHRLLLDMDSVKKDIDVLLSKSWIKRWSPNPKKKVDDEPPRGLKLEDMTEIKRWPPNPTNPKKKVDDEPPRGSKLKDIKKKWIPSIAAMALMAKIMNCSKAYDVCNRGAVMVWTTKGL